MNDENAFEFYGVKLIKTPVEQMYCDGCYFQTNSIERPCIYLQGTQKGLPDCCPDDSLYIFVEVKDKE